jgi:hydroxymethylbilane synthase
MPGRRLRVGVLDVESSLLHGTWLQERLNARWPELDVALRTLGARPRRAGRTGRGGTRDQIPVREFYSEPVYQALLRDDVDVGVHRMKDLPFPLPEGTDLIAVTERKTPLDVLVTADGAILDDLPEGARLGVSSLRREAQLARYRPDLELEFVVGSLSERIQLVDTGKLNGVVVAAAGIEWRGWQHRVSEVFTANVCLPAIAQGSLGLLVRCDDAKNADKVRFLNDALSRGEIEAERALFGAIGAWEGAPIGGLARVRGDILKIEGCVCSLDGRQILRDWAEGFPDDPLRTGERLAKKLLDLGAAELLDQSRRQIGGGANGGRG